MQDVTIALNYIRSLLCITSYSSIVCHGFVYFKNSSVYVNSKQVVENNLLFPDKNTTYKAAGPINENYHVVAEVMVKVVNRYLLTTEYSSGRKLLDSQIGVSLL